MQQRELSRTSQTCITCIQNKGWCSKREGSFSALVFGPCLMTSLLVITELGACSISTVVKHRNISRKRLDLVKFRNVHPQLKLLISQDSSQALVYPKISTTIPTPKKPSRRLPLIAPCPPTRTFNAGSPAATNLAVIQECWICLEQ